MRAPYTKLYVHLVWATWDRLPFIDLEMEAEMIRVLNAKTRELGCHALAIGGDFDHIHCLIRFTPTTSIAQLAGELKGNSSHWVNHVWNPNLGFKWQGAYGAFCISPNGVPKVVEYIRHQRQHHAHKNLRHEWEQCFTSEPDNFDDT